MPPRHDPLLAQIRRFPIHFDVQLVGQGKTRRIGKSPPELPEVKDESVRPALVLAQRGIGRGSFPQQNRAAHEMADLGIIPGLRADGPGQGQQEKEDECAGH